MCQKPSITNVLSDHLGWHRACLKFMARFTRHSAPSECQDLQWPRSSLIDAESAVLSCDAQVRGTHQPNFLPIRALIGWKEAQCVPNHTIQPCNFGVVLQKYLLRRRGCGVSDVLELTRFCGHRAAFTPQRVIEVLLARGLLASGALLRSSPATGSQVPSAVGADYTSPPRSRRC